MCDNTSLYSDPAFRRTEGAGSIYSEPPYRPSSPLCKGCQNSMSKTDLDLEATRASTSALCLNYSSLRHPDGASDPNLHERAAAVGTEDDTNSLKKADPIISLSLEALTVTPLPLVLSQNVTQLPAPTESYDSGHESTPRASKHSGISRRAESGYDSVASSLASGTSGRRISAKGTKIKYKYHHDKSFCSWLRNPFTCTYADTDAEVSDF